MANRNKGRRSRSRKRRPARQGAAQAPSAPAAAAGAEPKRKRDPSLTQREQRRRSRVQGAAQRTGSGLTGTLALGERPPAPWHPWPLSELLILIGAVGTVIGVYRREAGIPLLLAGLGAVLIGTLEVTLREHRSGYRAHTLLLTLLPAIAVYTSLVIALRPPLAVNLVLLVIDGAVSVFVFKRLRAKFLDARRERALAARR